MRWGALILKLAVLSVVVGFVLHLVGWTPEQVLRGFIDWVGDTFAWAARNARDLGVYLVSGAMIVVPVWGVFAVIRYVKNRRS